MNMYSTFQARKIQCLSTNVGDKLRDTTVTLHITGNGLNRTLSISLSNCARAFLQFTKENPVFLRSELSGDLLGAAACCTNRQLLRTTSGERRQSRPEIKTKNLTLHKTIERYYRKKKYKKTDKIQW